MMEIYPVTKEIEDTWLEIYYDDSFTVEVREWIVENVKDDWSVVGWSGVIGCILYFKDEEDAMAFKLRWL